MRNATRVAWDWEGTEILASRQVVRRVDRYRSAEGGRKQIWISRRCILDAGIEGVTPVAIGLCVDDITAQSNQCAILSIEIQRHRSNLKASFDLRFIIVDLVALVSLVVVILCAYLRGSYEHRSQAEQHHGSNNKEGLSKSFHVIFLRPAVRSVGGGTRTIVKRPEMPQVPLLEI